VYSTAIEMALAGSFSFSVWAKALAEIIITVIIAREMIKNNLFSFPLFIYTPPTLFFLKVGLYFFLTLRTTARFLT
jgi:hypothetical protein